MAIKTRDDLLKSLNALFGDDSTDENLSILEDITDTLDDYEKKTADKTDWKTKYEQNDADWRKKYRDRFMTTDKNDANDNEDNEDEGDEDEALHTFDTLFKEREV